MDKKEKYMENQTNKPLILEMDEAEIELTKDVNEVIRKHGLPCYLMVPMISKILSQLQAGAKAELDAAKAQFKEK